MALEMKPVSHVRLEKLRDCRLLFLVLAERFPIQLPSRTAPGRRIPLLALPLADRLDALAGAVRLILGHG